MAKYVENREFADLLVKYKEFGKKSDENKIGRIIISIANRYIKSPRFINYPYNVKSDMISEAIYHMWKYSVKGYSSDFGNPFAYFSQTCKHAFWQIINKYYDELESTLSINFLENIDGVTIDGKVVLKIDENNNIESDGE